MLVLSRKPGEALLIGDDVEVVILGIEGDRVKLGIQAPKQIDVVRKELLDEVTKENRQASANVPELDVINRLKQLRRNN